MQMDGEGVVFSVAGWPGLVAVWSSGFCWTAWSELDSQVVGHSLRFNTSPPQRRDVERSAGSLQETEAPSSLRTPNLISC